MNVPLAVRACFLRYCVQFTHARLIGGSPRPDGGCYMNLNTSAAHKS